MVWPDSSGRETVDRTSLRGVGYSEARASYQCPWVMGYGSCARLLLGYHKVHQRPIMIVHHSAGYVEQHGFAVLPCVRLPRWQYTFHVGAAVFGEVVPGPVLGIGQEVRFMSSARPMLAHPNLVQRNRYI